MRVVLLTRDGCLECARAERLLDRLAAEYRFSVATVDLTSPEGALLAERSGVLFAPGFVIDGEAVGYGRLAERQLRREIARRLGGSGAGAETPTAVAKLRRAIAARWGASTRP